MNEQLVQKVKNCPTLPSLPAIAVQVLELAQRSDADIGEIGRLISRDPALSTKLLKTVNSSFYARSQAVTTINHAVVILGLQSVKTLVLGFSLVSNLSKNKAKGFKHLTYWKRSIYAATASRIIASKTGVLQQEEAFLCALLEDIGMLVLDQILGEQYGDIHEKVHNHPELVAAEAAELQMTHADVGGILAEQWKLPPLLQVPIANHHNVDRVTDPVLRKLTNTIALGGRCADVFVDEQPASAITEVRQLLQKNYNMKEAEADALLNEIGTRTKEAASLFEINIGSGQSFEAVLKKANEALVELTLQSQMQTTQLQEQNQQLQLQAVTDGLTGLANRKRFDEFCTQALTATLGGPNSLSLIMIDIDKFKSINDKYGHPSGDAVIRALAKLLKTVARATDLAARYGGEEMALVMPNTPKAQAAVVAETLRKALAARHIPTEGGAIPVTASFGVAAVEPGSPIRQVAHLIKAADLALYNAKHSGRNNVKVFSLKPAGTAAA